jgi:hypothetical protein
MLKMNLYMLFLMKKKFLFMNLSKPIFSEKNNKDNLEFLNRMNPASKAVYFTNSF